MKVELNSQELQMICRALLTLKKDARENGIPPEYDCDLETFGRQVFHLYSVIDVNWDRAMKEEQQNED